MSDKIEDLRWIRSFSPDVIPKYLVDQVKHADYTTEDFYKYQHLNCMIAGKDGMKLNPFNHLYVLADTGNLVKGFAWIVLDPLSKDMVINTYSIDKEYWNKGKAVKKLSDHVKNIMKELNIDKVYWITKAPKHSEHYGFKRSKHTLMEYMEVKNGQNNDGGINPREEHIDAHAGTAASA